MYRILVVDDEAASRTGLKALLSRWGYEADDASNGKEALEKIRLLRPDVVVTDVVMPGMDGLELLKTLRKNRPPTAVIMVTGRGTIESAVSAIKEGAFDYVTKPIDFQRLRPMLAKALENADTRCESPPLRNRLKHRWGFGTLVGNSPRMQEVYTLIERAAPTSGRVLVIGESGTGKELVARTLHALSPRREVPFIAVNCAAIPETLLESEIFGHEKGAFTDAWQRRVGCFESAHTGTLFLDEVAEMHPALQARFLRVLQDGVIRRIGGTEDIRVDVRVLAATNKDPLQSIQDGKLREDLYYRLQVITIHVPPLRERKEDIPLLIERFLDELNSKYQRRVKGINEAALDVLRGYDWPGNVREFRNTIERAILVCDEELIGSQHLPPTLLARRATVDSGDALMIPVGRSLEDVEREMIVRTLRASANNKTRAAEVLGISLKTLHNKLRRYGIHSHQERDLVR